MKTIFLDVAPSNGRPREIGTMIAIEGRYGVFVGYDDQGRRIVIAPANLEKLIKSLNNEYSVNISVVQKKTFFKNMKEKVLSGGIKLMQGALEGGNAGVG